MSKKGKAAAGKKAPAKFSVPKTTPKSSVQLPALFSVPPTSVRRAKAQLLWLHSLSSLYRPVPASVLREICCYTADPPLLVLITPKSITAKDLIQGCEVATVQLQVKHHCWYQSYVALDETKVFCCGGMSNCHPDTLTKIGNPSNEVFTAALTTGLIETLPSMLVAREQCGLIIYDQVAYVFGGTDRGAVRSAACGVACELLRLNAATAWEALGNMNTPRVAFNPCLWRKEIYLCDGCSAEIFAPTSRLFRPIALDFPGKAGACVYVFRDELVVLGSSRVSKLKYEGGALVISSRDYDGYSSTVSHCQPVVWGSKVYLYWHGKVTVVEADTWQKLEEKQVDRQDIKLR